MTELTHILAQVGRGVAGAADELAARLYDELHAMAQREMANERAGHTLQPTALVHEAYLRLVSKEGGSFQNRAHFFGAAARAIRRVLVDHARGRQRMKRGEGAPRADLDAMNPAAPVREDALLALDHALTELTTFAPRLAELVELRFFSGMSLPEVAQLLKTSESTLQRDWRIARAWLRGKLGGHGEP